MEFTGSFSNVAMIPNREFCVADCWSDEGIIFVVCENCIFLKIAKITNNIIPKKVFETMIGSCVTHYDDTNSTLTRDNGGYFDLVTKRLIQKLKELEEEKREHQETKADLELVRCELDHVKSYKDMC